MAGRDDTTKPEAFQSIPVSQVLTEEDYSEVSHDVRIVFTAKTNWFSRLIRWITNGTVSHVFLEYDSTLWGGRWVAEATVGGVRKVPSYKARKNVVFEYRFLKDPRPGCTALAEYFGNKYDYVGMVGFAVFIVVWRWLHLKIKRPFRSSKAQLCSEFVARWFKASGVPVAAYLDPETTTPQMLYDICFQSRPGYFEAIEPPPKGVE